MNNKRVVYRKGQAPKGIDINDYSSSSSDEEEEKVVTTSSVKVREHEIVATTTTQAESLSVVDKRLQRLQSAAKNNIQAHASSSKEVLVSEKHEKEEDDVDRRARLRQKALDARRANNDSASRPEGVANGHRIPTIPSQSQIKKETSDDGNQEEESSSEEESSEEEEEDIYPKRVLFKPVFVSK